MAGIIRTIHLSNVQGSNFDKTWLGFNVFAAGIAEGNIGIICACAPSIKSCFRAYFTDDSTTVEMKSRQNSASEERRLVSSGTIGARSSRDTQGGPMVPPKDAGSFNIVEVHGFGARPDVPQKDRDRGSQTIGSQPSRVYFTITDEDALPLSNFPMPPRA